MSDGRLRTSLPDRPALIITRGLPASGKTTWALNWVASDEENRARCNRDEMRMALFGRYWPVPEGIVTRAQQAAVRALLDAGISVVVDDTNLRSVHARAWRALATSAGASFLVKDLSWVPVEDCIARDKARGRTASYGRMVGEDVIRGMAVRYLGKGLAPLPPEPEIAPGRWYLPNVSNPTAWLVDLDGTLAHFNDRGPFDWHRVGEDRLDETVAHLVHMLNLHHTVIYMSGRDASCRAQTITWLQQHKLPVNLLLMRPEKDTRKDAIVKAELFWENVADRFNVLGVLDDRDQVVEMWRAMGLKCLQVAPGAF